MRIVGLIACFFSFSVWSVTLTVPDIFRVLSVNNTQIKQTFLVNATTLKMQPGMQVVELQYVDMFDRSFHNDHTKVSSEPFIIRFNVESGSQLTFITPRILDLKDAQLFAQAPTIEIHNEFGKPLTIYHLMTNLQQVAKTTSEQAVASKESTSSSQETKSANNTQDNPPALPMLKYWWLQASEEEKGNFIKFIEDKNKQ